MNYKITEDNIQPIDLDDESAVMKDFGSLHDIKVSIKNVESDKIAYTFAMSGPMVSDNPSFEQLQELTYTVTLTDPVADKSIIAELVRRHLQAELLDEIFSKNFISNTDWDFYFED